MAKIEVLNFKFRFKKMQRWVLKGPVSRSFSTAAEKLPSTLMSDVHGTTHGRKEWRNKPLFRREGDRRFRTGLEASEMLFEEAIRRDPYQKEYDQIYLNDILTLTDMHRFLQTTKMFLFSICPVFDRYPKYAWVMKQLLEPERAIQFRVPWVDDTGNHRVCRGYRVQFSSSLGPYLGGLRFHPKTNHGTVKFLAFDHVFRNALAGEYGGAAGGSDFDPIGKSESEIMRFCQSFMTELTNYIGPDRDIPTAGVGVGQREIGYMFGQYKRLQNVHGSGWSGVVGDGNFLYPQTTGYGVALFAQSVVQASGQTLQGKRCVISGSGKTALHLAEKLLDLGATVLSLSDSSGYIVEPEGFTREKLAILKKIKAERNARIGEYIMASTSAQFHAASEGSIWEMPCDYAFPCSIQNNIDESNATKLIDNGCVGVFEGTNMPLTEEVLYPSMINHN